jgi:hypothetical protein
VLWFAMDRPAGQAVSADVQELKLTESVLDHKGPEA